MINKMSSTQFAMFFESYIDAVKLHEELAADNTVVNRESKVVRLSRQLDILLMELRLYTGADIPKKLSVKQKYEIVFSYDEEIRKRA